MVSLDCAGLNLTAVELTQLFFSIPETWDFTELGEFSTLLPSLRPSPNNSSSGLTKIR